MKSQKIFNVLHKNGVIFKVTILKDRYNAISCASLQIMCSRADFDWG